MHDELKLEAQTLLDQEAGWGNGIGRFTMVSTEITVRAIVKALARTLPPANTDVERVAVILEEWDMRPPPDACTGHSYRDIALDIVSALSLTRPAGGEEVERLVEIVSGLADVLEHDSDCQPCSGSMAPGEHYLGLAREYLADRPAALTKPPALPKEGEELWRETVQRVLRDSVSFSDDAQNLSAQQFILNRDDRIAAAIVSALSSLPVRSGEVERLRELSERATAGPWAYRPQEHDDWGFIRSTVKVGDFCPIVAVAKGPRHADDEHRRNGTDPAEPDGRFIVACVNHVRAALATPQQVKDCTHLQSSGATFNETGESLNALTPPKGADHE